MSEALKEVRVLRLRPGDAVYVESPHELSHQEALLIASGVREWLIEAGHQKIPVMLLTNGHQLKRIAAEHVSSFDDDAGGEVFMIGSRR